MNRLQEAREFLGLHYPYLIQHEGVETALAAFAAIIDRELSVPIRTNGMSKAIALVLGELDGIPRQADDTTSFRIGKAIAALSKLHKELSVPSTEGEIEEMVRKYIRLRFEEDGKVHEATSRELIDFAKHLLREGKEEGSGVAPSDENPSQR